MKHLPLLALFNLLNTIVLWLMYRGASTTGEVRLVWLVFAFHLLVVFGSFAFYSIRNRRLAQFLVLWSDARRETERVAIARIASLTGAYGLAGTNFVAAIVMYFLNGTINVWVSGSAT